MTIKSTPAHWVLDKRVNGALVITAIAQVVFVGLWVGVVQTRLNYLEKNDDKLASDVSRIAIVETTLAVVKSEVVGIGTTLNEIKRDIKEMSRKSRKP